MGMTRQAGIMEALMQRKRIGQGVTAGPLADRDVGKGRTQRWFWQSLAREIQPPLWAGAKKQLVVIATRFSFAHMAFQMDLAQTEGCGRYLDQFIGVDIGNRLFQ